MTSMHTALQSQKAVSAYLYKSRYILYMYIQVAEVSIYCHSALHGSIYGAVCFAKLEVDSLHIS